MHPLASLRALSASAQIAQCVASSACAPPHRRCQARPRLARRRPVPRIHAYTHPAFPFGTFASPAVRSPDGLPQQCASWLSRAWPPCSKLSPAVEGLPPPKCCCSPHAVAAQEQRVVFCKAGSHLCAWQRERPQWRRMDDAMDGSRGTGCSLSVASGATLLLAAPYTPRFVMIWLIWQIHAFHTA